MHSKFTDIGQFRDVIRNIKQSAQFVRIDDDGEIVLDHNAELPIVSFHGTVKLHGTNAGVAMDKDETIWYQGRKRNVSIEKDNAGFAFFADSKEKEFREMLKDIRKSLSLEDETVIIFGEWCGGNIQKGVGLNQLEKMFVIFAVKIITGDEDGNYYLPRKDWEQYRSPENRIFNINDYKSFDIDIDFSFPQKAVDELGKITEAVEKECPVSKAFDIEGIGEGVVWEGYYKGNRYTFKVKGEKHASSKVKTLAPVDIEKMESVNEFVDYAVTENRLNQAIEQVFTGNSIKPSQKGTGDFLKWIVNDIVKEESDTMVKNGLEPKDVNKSISTKARTWFFTKLDEDIFGK